MRAVVNSRETFGWAETRRSSGSGILPGAASLCAGVRLFRKVRFVRASRRCPPAWLQSALLRTWGPVHDRRAFPQLQDRLCTRAGFLLIPLSCTACVFLIRVFKDGKGKCKHDPGTGMRPMFRAPEVDSTIHAEESPPPLGLQDPRTGPETGAAEVIASAANGWEVRICQDRATSRDHHAAAIRRCHTR